MSALSCCAVLATQQPAAGATAATPAAATAPRTPPPSQLVVSVRLNAVAKGDFVAYITADLDFLFSPQDLMSMGIARPASRTVEVAGENFISLKSIDGAELKFNEKTLTLDLRVPASMLPSQSMDFGSTLPSAPVHARAAGGFLNYRLGYSHSQSGFSAYNGATELGLNIGKLLLLDNRVFSASDGKYRSVRLQTQLIYDQPESLRRWTFGDTFASSGELGSALNLGGISVSKIYQINPYLIKQPLAGFSGAVALPSTVDVYMDGARVRSERIAPGSFNLQNLNNYSGTGLRNIEYVIKDAFGREQRFGFPYFFSDQLLAKGLHEYSYNAGFIRKNYGSASDEYGTLAVSVFHRYGLSDAITVGFGGDATRSHINLGPQASLNTGRAGVITVGAAYSRTTEPEQTSGLAATLGHSFLAGPFSSQILVRRFTKEYSVIGFGPTDKPKLQGSAGISYGSRNAGTFSIGYAMQTMFGGATDQRSTTVGYSRTLGRNVSFVANASRITSDSTGYAAFVGLTYFGSNGHTANITHVKSKDGETSQQLQLSKSPPIGEGFGYRLFAQRSAGGGSVSESISPFVQYNAPHAILTAESTSFVSGGTGGSDFYQIAIAGAAAFVGGDVYFSRPINDSYGVAVIEPPLAGVRVLKSNAEIGATNSKGAVFVPNLGSYQVNDVAIQAKDIPLDYTVRHTTQKLRPAFRAGVVSKFDVLRIRAIAGRLKVRRSGTLSALEGYEVTLLGGGGKSVFNTIRGGEFYIENLAPGRYSAQLNVEGKSCSIELAIPDTNEIVTDLGDIICENPS